MNTKAAPYVNLNDGTIRLTVRWKPELYNHLSTNFADQTKEIESLLQQLFENGDTNATLIQWTAKDTRSTKSIGAIIQEKILNEYLSPKITHLNTSQQIIFGIRACFGNHTPSAWITQPSIKAILATNNLHLSLSNSRCDSGEVVTAGHLLFKHPQHTHRHFYLLSLRRILPENTPFFDLGTLHRTPHGEEITHLIIRCGSNHVDALTDIMSDYLDGADNNTVLFLANKLVVSMTQEESHSMFTCHADFVKQIQRIPLHPFVVNHRSIPCGIQFRKAHGTIHPRMGNYTPELRMAHTYNATWKMADLIAEPIYWPRPVISPRQRQPSEQCPQPSPTSRQSRKQS
jgi:hypothetical protein